MSPSRRRAIGAVRGMACAPPVPRGAVPLPCAPLVPRCGRARWSAAGPPGSRRRAITLGGSRHRGARLGIVRPAESFACRGLPAGAPRPRNGARQDRAPGAMVGHRASRLAPPLPTQYSRADYARPRGTRITRAARWGHRALPPLPTRITHAHYPWGLPTARRGSRPPGQRNQKITRENRTPTTPRRMVRAEAHRLAHRHQCTIGKHPPTKAPARTAPSAAHCCN